MGGLLKVIAELRGLAAASTERGKKKTPGDFFKLVSFVCRLPLDNLSERCCRCLLVKLQCIVFLLVLNTEDVTCQEWRV